ncbi:hypothetical protein E2C01_012952 [Portunus trituberculatus]|uniref:Uncharacterized protein n=1 Tax=Portunus trituberculatus TaxID=210409 RepID=A0A5B7DEY9_PORTR|nr:hypothetical protein [Portunus trituberculatus]
MLQWPTPLVIGFMYSPPSSPSGTRVLNHHLQTALSGGMTATRVMKTLNTPALKRATGKISSRLTADTITSTTERGATLLPWL